MEQVYKKDGTLINLLQDADVEAGAKYIKFSNGILICWDYPLRSANVNSQWGSLYFGYIRESIKFPMPFIYAPVITLTCQNQNVICATLAKNGYTKDSINEVMLISAEAVSNYEMYLHYIAIGRWK